MTHVIIPTANGALGQKDVSPGVPRFTLVCKLAVAWTALFRELPGPGWELREQLSLAAELALQTNVSPQRPVGAFRPCLSR